MYLPKWNIGLEIQSDRFIAVALQQKRYGWQLRGWWHVSLGQSVFNQQGLFKPDVLTHHLTQWRKSLPKSISLRMVLPSHLVLQQPLKLPRQPLSPQELGWYIDASISKLFPLSAHELIIDYRMHTVAAQQQLLITATRRNELSLWVNSLNQAGLLPEAVDIAPCILRVIAHFCQVPTGNLLIHKQESDYLLVSPLTDDFYFERLNPLDLSPAQCKELACERYNKATGKTVKSVSISGDVDIQHFDDDISYWSPFSAIQQLQPPMPKTTALFTIACGLALRETDYDTSQSAALA